MTARYLSGPLARVLVELATAAASKPGMTVKEWITLTRRKAQQGG